MVKHVRVKGVDPDLDTMVDAYITCALWSSNDERGDPLDDNYSADDLTPECRARMAADGKRFLVRYESLVDGYPAGPLGHDFWLTRNRHGAGFWDGDYPQKDGDLLTKAAHAFGETSLYVGDDGRIHHE